MNSDDKESTLSPTPDHNTARHDVREDPPLELEDSTENLSIQSKLRTDSAWNSTRWHYGRYALPIFCCSAAFLLHLRARRTYPMVRSRRWTTVALAESYASLAFWWSCHMDMNEFREEAYRDEGLCDLHVYASAYQARRAGAAIIRGHQLDLRIVEGLNGDYSESDVAIDTYPSTDILPKVRWWWNHVWSSATLRMAVRSQVLPNVGSCNLSPHDRDVCVTQLANGMDKQRWIKVDLRDPPPLRVETLTNAIMVTLLFTAPVDYLVAHFGRPRIGVWMVGLQRASLYGYLLFLPALFYQRWSYPSTITDRRGVCNMLDDSIDTVSARQDAIIKYQRELMNKLRKILEESEERKGKSKEPLTPKNQ